MSELAAEGERLGIDLSAPGAIALIERAQAREPRPGDVVETRSGARCLVADPYRTASGRWLLYPLSGGGGRTARHLTFVESFELRQARESVRHVRRVLTRSTPFYLRGTIDIACAWLDAAEQRGAGEGDAIRELAAELADLTPEETE